MDPILIIFISIVMYVMALALSSLILATIVAFIVKMARFGLTRHRK